MLTINQPTRKDYQLALVASLCVLLAGCHLSFPNVPPPSIEELMHEAVVESAARARQDSLVNFSVFDDSIETVSEDEELPVPEAEESISTAAVNQEFFETDLREALLLMASDAEVNIVLDDEVRGVVNASIEDLPFEAALDRVLLPFGYVYAIRNGQYLIGLPDPRSALFSHIAEQREYVPKHLDSDALLQAIPDRLAAYVRVVDAANRLVIEAPRRDADQIVMRLEQIDRAAPQVILEAIVCVISPDCGFRFGVDWNHLVRVDGEDLLRVGANGLAISGSVTGAGVQQALDDFAATSAFVKLLEEHGYLTIRAAPRVMAKDGEMANISINRETFFSPQPLSNSAAGDNSAFFFQNDIQKVESGITLEITPHIRDDIVTVDINRAEVSEDIRNANPDLALNPFPVINRRSVSTTVHVEDGKTIVIGGLVQQQVVDRISEVPGLARLPVLGNLFKTVQRQEQDAEVVIFISPRIVAPMEATDRIESTTVNTENP